VPDRRRIDDYALIGNCRSAALIGRDGSVDWLCWPKFDSPSVFGALVDAERGGRFCVRPVGAFETSRRYLPETNVLETTFKTGAGVATLRDCMTVSGQQDQKSSLLPEHELLRELEGQAGEVEFEVRYAPRPDYARRTPRLRRHRAFGVWLQDGGSVVILNSDVGLDLVEGDQEAAGRIRISAGQQRHFALSFTGPGPAIIPALGPAAHARLERTIQWWRQWADQSTYDGPYRHNVVRSALALKLMTYAPSGAIIAAPTTSLPERMGGSLNWDYRYCWLRDASFVVRALFALGYRDEANAFVSWMLQATRLTWPQLQVLYDVFGEAHVPETELHHLSGFMGSRPVRVGNAAWAQLQLDIYGELIDAAARFISQGGSFDRQAVRLLDDLGETVCRRWREPDSGMWESRGERTHHTQSKVMCWVALDRLVRLHEGGHVDVQVDRFRSERDAIRAAIERRAYNARLGTYTGEFDGDQLDASLLLLPVYGYVQADEPRMQRTTQCVVQRLGSRDLVRRHSAASGQTEGAFGACSFWAVEALALGGQLECARTRFERVLGYANDVGLFAEEVDPQSGAALGNFPQAFTHVAMINSALILEEIGRGH
jgi:GH15 family glucan-1,4-alpha-glucosidase